MIFLHCLIVGNVGCITAGSPVEGFCCISVKLYKSVEKNIIELSSYYKHMSFNVKVTFLVQTNNDVFGDIK